MTLKYTWTAYYQDGRTLNQYGSEGNEHLFKEIEEHNLEKFQIKNDNKTFEVNLNTGMFIINNTSIRINHLKDGLKRLIYFRRTLASTDGAFSVKHCLGMQSTIENTNKKIMLLVDNDTDSIELVLE